MLIPNLEISLGKLESILRNHTYDTDFGLNCMLIRCMAK